VKKKVNRPGFPSVYTVTMLKRSCLFLMVPLLLAACAPTEQQRADESAVERSGVSPAIYDKMLHDDPLSVSDVAALSRNRVNDGIILRYMRDHGTVYVLSPGEIGYLQQNNVSPSIIDYMVQTGQGVYPGGPGYYPPPPVSIGIGVGGGYWGGGRWGGGRWR
jgi:hypothetical protein